MFCHSSLFYKAKRQFRRTAVLGYGREGDRTPDLRIANAALSQLSYTPLKTMRILLFALSSVKQTMWAMWAMWAIWADSSHLMSYNPRLAGDSSGANPYQT